MSIELMRDFLIKKYPSGTMNGRKISQMPDNQIFAIYNRVINYKPKPKQIHGQTSLFK